MRAVHRVISLFVVLITLYLGVTGSLMEGIDLRSLLRHVPASDPELLAMQQEQDGPDEYALLGSPEYTAPPLPAGFSFQGSLPALLGAAQRQFGDASLTYLEFRMSGAGPVGRVLSGHELLQYDFATAQSQLIPIPKREPAAAPSTRNVIKHLHRMTSFGDWALWINPIVGISLGVFIVTGLVLYLRVLFARRRVGRRNWFWTDRGGWWRILHRWVSLVAALFVVVITLSGEWLALESLLFGYYMAAHHESGKPFERISGVGLIDRNELPNMLATTLTAYHSSLAGQPLKVLRLRAFGGMPQGALVTGLGDSTQQTVFNATSGREASLTEPGYPPTGFPWGWRAHQIAKQIHRGSYFGLSGAWMGLLAGLSVIYLSISGIVMYWSMWQRRRRSGRGAILWT